MRKRIANRLWTFLARITRNVNTTKWIIALLLSFSGIIGRADSLNVTSPEVTVVATTPVVRESDQHSIVFTFHRTGLLDSALYVFFDVGGTASADGDYDWFEGLARFEAGSATEIFEVQL